mgnify:CR=1 FL=1
MKIILKKSKLFKLIQNEKNLGFVPTMGAIHLGHISLIKRSIKQCNKTIVSIFINKPQFNKKTDYINYPRLIKKDINILKKTKIDYLYLPETKQIYPKKYSKNIEISNFSKQLCGKFRPGHFKAVVDVIDRFIKIIGPNRIYFGEKDMQQLLIIKDFVKRKYPKIKILGCKTIRESNGIPYSSRNFLLSSNEKIIAANVFNILKKNKKKIIKNRKKLNNLKKDIISYGISKIDYIKVLDVNKIIKPFKKIKKYKIFVAYYLGSTRLIDNI